MEFDTKSKHKVVFSLDHIKKASEEKRLQEVERLSIWEEISDEVLKFLPQMTNIQALTLDISKKNKDWKVVNFFSAWTKLESLTLSGKGAEAEIKIFDSLEKLSNLKELRIKLHGLQREKAEKLAKVLETLTKLESLYLNVGQIGFNAMVKIFDSLKKLTNLKQFSLSDYRFDFFIRNDLTVVFTESLKGLTKLESLDLYDIGIRNNEMIEIFDSLKKVSNLKELTLYFHQLGNETAEKLAEELKELTKLESLELGGYKTSTSVIIKIFDSLKKLTNLKKLILLEHKCEVGKEKEFIEPLKELTTLKYLRIYFDDLKAFSIYNTADPYKVCKVGKMYQALRGMINLIDVVFDFNIDKLLVKFKLKEANKQLSEFYALDQGVDKIIQQSGYQLYIYISEELKDECGVKFSGDCKYIG